MCERPMCPELIPPVNGLLVFPCTREEGHSCNVVCADSYSIIGPSQQICEYDSSTADLKWSEGPTCEGKCRLSFHM